MQFQGTLQGSLGGDGFNTAISPVAFQNPCIKAVSPLFMQDLEEVYSPLISGLQDDAEVRGGKFMFFKKNNVHRNWYTIFLGKVKGGIASETSGTIPRRSVWKRSFSQNPVSADFGPMRKAPEGRKIAKKAPGKPRRCAGGFKKDATHMSD
jgi:hypothetical protein